MTTLRWYVERLRSMSAPEIAHRLEQRMMIERERRALARYYDAASLPLPEDALARFCDEQRTPLWVSMANRMDRIAYMQTAYPEGVDATIQAAEELLAHRIDLFGYTLELDETIDWQRDPLTGNRWPENFWADIDTRDGETVGGVKWVWELNRHHHLVTLAKAAYLTDDDRYAEEACRQLQSWIEFNRSGYGVNWTSSLEMALRLINWSWMLAFLRHFACLTPSLFDQVQRSVILQARHIARHLSSHSSANNHLIGEAAGLAVTGMVFPWMQDAARWRHTGTSIMLQELSKQILNDGVPAEQAPGYLTFILDFNLHVWQLAYLNGQAIPAKWRERLGLAATFLAHIMDASGNVPAIGDSDDASVVRLNDAAGANRNRSVIASAAALLSRSDLKAAAGHWDEASEWLLGPAARTEFAATASSREPLQSRLFKTGGYCVLRSGETIATFDCGPLGYLSTAAHGHADALSIWVSADGQPVLVDAGTYAYQEGGRWRTFLRSTAAHNTIELDARDQSEMLGDFLWGRRASSSLIEWRAEGNMVWASASHDGYDNLGITHRRSVYMDGSDWLILIDTLLGHGEHEFQQFWHFPVDCSLFIDGHDARVSLPGRTVLFRIAHDFPLDITTVSGADNPPQGWVSTAYGHIHQAPALSVAARRTMPVALTTSICLKPDAYAPSHIDNQFAALVWMARQQEDRIGE